MIKASLKGLAALPARLSANEEAIVLDAIDRIAADMDYKSRGPVLKALRYALMAGKACNCW